MNVTLHNASSADLPVVRNLTAYYIYEMSGPMGWPCKPNGTFGGCDSLESYFTDPGKHAFILRDAGEPAGFVLILADNPEPDVDYSITDFFIVRKFQHHGVGERIARELFDRFRGRWKVEHFVANKPAAVFWRKVIDRYSRGTFEESSGTSQWGDMKVFRFRS